MVKVSNLQKTFGAKAIFNGADIALGKKEIAGLVGINGVGKTTLFKILSGEDAEFQGSVVHDTKHPLIGYMKQNLNIENSNISILEFLKKYTGIENIETELNQLMSDLESQDNLDRYGDVYEMFEKVGGYEFDHKVEKLLGQIGLGKYSLESNVDKLSGGEKRKLLLCGTLIKGGDLLLLDEPTNDLDTSSIEGLVSFLRESLAACLVVSHDKVFLNKVVKKIFEIDNGKIIQYSGDYNFYEQQKKLAYQQNLNAYEQQVEEEARVKKITQELKQKAQNIGNKGNTRDNDKGDGASKVEKKLAQSAKVMQNRIERIEKIDKPKVKKPIQMTFSVLEEPTGGINVENVLFNYEGNDKFKLNIKSLFIGSSEKMLVYGGNGGGKSTFLKLLTGDIEPQSGIIKKNNSLKIGYFAQEQANLPNKISPIDFLHGELGYSLTDVHAVFGGLGFDDVDKKKNIEILSPGMRLRLVFALLMLKKNNCLILDEPTNHVDIEIKEALKKAIGEFKGILIIVSHDNDFVKDINFSKKVFFKDGIGAEE